MIEITKTKLDLNTMMKGITWYVIGQPKTGKTTNLSKWSDTGSEGTLILDTDLGTDFLNGANIVPILSIYPPYEMVDSKKVLIQPNKRGFVYRNGPNRGKEMSVYSMGEIIQAMHTDVGLGFDTIVIDTVDKINEWAETQVKADLGIDEIGDAGFGAGWAKAKDMVINIVAEFQSYVKKHGKTLVLVSHAKETQMTDGKVQLGPALPAGLAKIPTIHNKVFEFDYSTIKRAALEEPKSVKQVEKAPEVPSTNGAITDNNNKQMEAMNG